MFGLASKKEVLELRGEVRRLERELLSKSLERKRDVNITLQSAEILDDSRVGITLWGGLNESVTTMDAIQALADYLGLEFKVEQATDSKAVMAAKLDGGGE